MNHIMRTGIVMTAMGLVVTFTFPTFAQTTPMQRNGFDLTDSSIPPEQVFPGGPPRDGIPSIDQPTFISAKEAGLSTQDRVLGVSIAGEAKAYPIGILNYHEIVNDVFGTIPVVITYCPLCGSGIAFRAEVNGSPKTFGVSGLLYNSDVLLYDRETESLWSQILMESVSGPEKGQTLTPIPTEHTTWKAWKVRYPGTWVLSEETGHNRDYNRTPYEGYKESERLYFPVTYPDKRYHPKELTLGVNWNGGSKAYPFTELAKVQQTPIRDELNGESVNIFFDAQHTSARIETKSGTPIPSITLYWFAWFTFHPDTQVFTGKKPK